METPDNNNQIDLGPFTSHTRRSMYSTQTYSGYDFNHVETIKTEIYGAIKSKFNYLNIFNDILDSDSILHAVVFCSNGDIVFDNNKISVSAGDWIATIDQLDLRNFDNIKYIHYVFGYANKSESLQGSGDKTYEVTALIRDEYRITVLANSADEAISIADQIPISDWEHPTIPADSNLIDRRIIRHARWGNLSAKEV